MRNINRFLGNYLDHRRNRCFITADEELARKTLELINSGISIRKAASILQISKSSVHTIVKKFREGAGLHFLNALGKTRRKFQNSADDSSLDLDPFFEAARTRANQEMNWPDDDEQKKKTTGPYHFKKK
ncbi:hypothetical protein HUJ04_008564 [Dendroctonus ponderosae]|nr:hypothetical protein HUJ04_008564 [Dendroctonus ponderosae]